MSTTTTGQRTYFVAVRRSAIDYVPLTASSEEEAMERARTLLNNGCAHFLLGDDGYDEDNVIGANEEATSTTEDAEAIAENDDALDEIGTTEDFVDDLLANREAREPQSV